MVDVDILGVPGRIIATWYISDVKSNNAPGGTTTAGSWVARVLNTIEGDTSDTSVTIASNQITMLAGTYFIDISAPAFDCRQHKIKFQNVATPADFTMGTSEISDQGDPSTTRSFIEDKITLTATTVFEIQHRVTFLASTPTQTLGFPSNFGEDEIYTLVKIEKLQ